jgi:hypothetical protein
MAAKLTGVRCLSIGRALARTECGLAYAARAIAGGRAQDLQVGLNTVRFSVKYVDQMMPTGAGLTRKILSKVSSMDRDLKKSGKISTARAKEMFKDLQDLKLDVDRLFATGASQCPGGKGKR